MKGTLYGLGLGPGDPELVTRKAWRLIQQTQIIAYPQPDFGPEEAPSFARSIAAEAIGDDKFEIPMIVPMRTERFPAQDIYAQSAIKIAQHLDQGRDVAVLCEGDPFFYGSFMYLFARLSEGYLCEIVPGVSSVMAVASALKRPICGRNDTLAVIPGTLPEAEIEKRILGNDAIAIMKLGRHLPKVKAVLQRLGLVEKAGYVSHASLPHQEVWPLEKAPEKAPYFSMLLIYKGDDPWL